jgi:hypothetical protein
VAYYSNCCSLSRIKGDKEKANNEGKEVMT